jgi:hypothetical protein
MRNFLHKLLSLEPGSQVPRDRFTDWIRAVRTHLQDARHKLGRSWHTRRLSSGTRRSRAASLTKLERRAARAAGWIR